MKIVRIPSALALALPLVLAGCVIYADSDSGSSWSFSGINGSGNLVTETRSVPDFKRISTAGSMDVTVKVGSPTSVDVTADDNLLPYVTTEVVDGTLKIGMKSGRYHFTKGHKIAISTPALEKFAISGSSDVDIGGLDGERFEASISGSGDLHARGRVGSASGSISGSGDLDLRDLEARDVHVSIAGSGDARVNATEKLDVKIAGSGDVQYRGSPSVTKSVAGSGSVARE
jgi:hypothetical protein